MTADYEKLLSTQHFIEEDLDYRILELHIPFLERIDKMSSSAFMIFDLYKRKHVFVSANTAMILHLDTEKAQDQDTYFENRMHPDDLLKLMETGTYFLKYGFSVPRDEKKEGKLVSEYRIQNEKGEYIRIIEQQMCLELDKHGNVWLALGIVDVSPDQDPDAPFRSRLIKLKTKEVFMFPPPNKSAMLSAREKEILKYISEGLISKEIADKLFISVNTVNTHRQRIIEKLNVSNTFEALKYARNIGLIA